MAHVKTYINFSPYRYIILSLLLLSIFDNNIISDNNNNNNNNNLIDPHNIDDSVANRQLYSKLN